MVPYFDYTGSLLDSNEVDNQPEEGGGSGCFFQDETNSHVLRSLEGCQTEVHWILTSLSRHFGPHQVYCVY